MRSSLPEDDCADEAMDRYAAGDEAAFVALYERLAPCLYGFLLRRTRDRERTADLLQQTFLHIHRARRSFVPGAQVRPWMWSIARRLLIDSARLATRDVVLAYQWELIGVAAQAADDLMDARQLAARLADEVARLPEPQRLAFELKQRGLSLAEAARALRISTGAVKLRIHRAHVALRTALDCSEAEFFSVTPPARLRTPRSSKESKK
jgi:RNA polymerase sigma-70 factor, ECF subfamily